MKKLTALLTVVFVLLAYSSLAFAWGGHRTNGQPEEFRPGDSRGYFIWREGDTVHLRVTTYGREHTFSGVIRTDGRFYHVRGFREENGDFHRSDRDHDSIFFRFHTAGGVDGIDFKVGDADKLNFDLFIDGHRISPHQIYVGHRGWHPDDNSFDLYR